MKRLDRSDRTIDYVRLLSEHARTKGVSAYSDAVLSGFGDHVAEGLRQTAYSEHRIRGLRAESLFLAVVAGIGDVALIKAEDEGDAYFNGPDISVPDFRVVTSKGEQLLVEVKTVKGEEGVPKPLSFSPSYVERLSAYATQTSAELVFAVFWEGPRVWTLNRLSAFRRTGQSCGKWSIGFLRAMATNEMQVVGDASIATLAPIRLRIEFDPTGTEPLRPGVDTQSIRAVISAARLFSQSRPLKGLSAEIAWKLLLHGRWDKVSEETKIEGSRLLWVDHVCGPPDWSEEEDDPNRLCVVSSLSEMVTHSYLEGAEHTIHTTSTASTLEPGVVGAFIPKDFASMNLDIPLWVLHLMPNYNLHGDDGSATLEHGG